MIKTEIQMSITQIILLGDQLPLVNQHTTLINRQTRNTNKIKHETHKIERIAGIQHPLPFHQHDLLSPLPLPNKKHTTQNINK